MEHERPLELIPDDELLRRLREMLKQSRRTEADLVALVAEVDARRLYARDACPSMFAWCTEVLHLSEAEAYLRITAGRASREHPVLLTMLAEGRLHLSGIAKLAPHLTPQNRDALLERAGDKSKRQIEALLAELAPRPDAPALMRKLPERRPMLPPAATRQHGSDRAASAALELRPDGVEPLAPELRPDGAAAPVLGVRRPERAGPSPVRPAVVEPLAPARYKVQFTASAELHDKLERLRILMRSSVPNGDLAEIIGQAVAEKLERLESRRFAKANSPRKGLAESDTSPSSRHIPAAVRRAVYERDGGCCHYEDEHGRRCTARAGLELHHRHPYGHGGRHDPDNISLLCRVHNQLLADLDFGRESMARHRGSGGRVSEALAVYSVGMP